MSNLQLAVTVQIISGVLVRFKVIFIWVLFCLLITLYTEHLTLGSTVVLTKGQKC